MKAILSILLMFTLSATSYAQTLTTIQPIAASSLPLPTGAATSANQTNGSARSQIVDGSNNVIPFPTALGAGGGIKVDGSGTALPISGTVSATQSGTWNSRIQDGAGNGLTSAARGSERALTVQIVDGSGAQITSFGGSGGTASNFGSAFPTPGTAAGFSDGTNMQGARVFDGDSGAGTQYVQGINLRKAASGGTVEAGTSSDPLRTDPTGTTTQPVSGTVTVTDGAGALNVIVDSGTITTVSAVTAISNALPAGNNNVGDVDVASIAAGDNNIGNVDVVTLPALPAGTNNIGDVDVLTMPGTGVEDAAETAGGTLVMLGTVRRDTAASSAGATGDNSTLNTDASGRLWVNCGTGCSGGTQYAIGAVSGATDIATMAGAIRDDSLSTLADADGDVVGLRTSSTGALWVQSATLDAAESAAVSTNPVPIGCVNRTTPTTLADGDVGYVLCDTSTRQVMVGAGTAGTAAGGVLTVQGVASMTKLLVTPDSVALPANQSVNVSQINGVTPLMGNGASGTGAQRVTIANDSTGQIALAAGSATIGALTANQSVNVAQMNGVTTLMGAGATGTGSQRVTEANDSALTANTASMVTALQLIDDSQTGDSVHYRTSAGSTEDEHEIKATAGRLFSVAFTNTNAAVRYWRCANLTAANTTPGTSTVFVGLAIPGATTGAGFTHTFGPNGIAFSTALTCWFVTGAADSDVAEVAANEIKAIYSFK